MSSHDADLDVDIDVVSSPEPSRNNSDDESPRSFSQRHELRHHSPQSSHHASNLASSLLTSSNATLSPSAIQSLQNHSAHLFNNQLHCHLSNSLLNCSSNNEENLISATENSRLSPPRTPETNNNNSISSKLSPTTTKNSGYTSFSISSILSRQDSPDAKKLMAPIPHFPMNGAQDAAMISR